MKRSFVHLSCGVLLFAAGCAPLFSDMQSARLVGKRKFEVTPGYTSAGRAFDGHRESIINYLGFQTAYGLSDKVDLRVRVEHGWLKRSYTGESYERTGFTGIGIGPKISLRKDRAALYLPVGYAQRLVQFQPTVLLTFPVINNKVELNPSAKHILTFCDVCWEPLLAVNLGVGISSDLRKWAIRPEYGLLYDLGSQGHYTNFAVGFSMNLSALSK